MMMTNGGTSYEWQFDVDDDADFVADDGSMSMDIESFFSILDESPPDDSSQSGLPDPSLTIAPYNEPASHVGVNDHSQTLDDHSEASASRTVCSSGSSDYERQTVNHGLNEMGPLPDGTTKDLYSWTPGDWATNVVSRDFSSSNQYDNWEDLSSSSHYDTKETNILRSSTTNGGGSVGTSDCKIDHQLIDKSGMSDGVFSSHIMYNPNDKSSMPYFTNRNEPSHQNSGPHHPMIYYRMASEQHLMPNASSNSENSTDTPSNVSINGTHFTSMLPNRRQIASLMEGTYDDSPSVEVTEKSCDVGDRLFTNKGLLQSLSGAILNSVSRNDLVVKGEQDTKPSTNLFNIRNSSVADNRFLNVQSPAKPFIQHDFSIMNQQASMPMLPKVNQQAVTYIDLDEPDICILEDMSVSAPRKPFPVDEKSTIVAHRSTINVPPAQIGYNNGRLKANDERFIYRVALQDLSQPKSEAYAPDGALEVPLLRHQRIALSWMVHKETKSMHCFGGILADDQGLGKTISTIALILKERSPPSSVHTPEVKKIETETFNLDDDDDVDDENDDDDVADLNKSRQNSCLLKTDGNSIDLKNAKSRPSAGTLVVCPTSVLRQWNDELHNKVSSKASLSVLVYHGANRTKDPCELAKYDVVLTTYAIVSMEVPKQPLVDEDEDETKRRNEFHPVGLSPGKKRKYPPSSSKNSKKGKKGIDNELFESLARPLAKVGWFRVILDEAQSIKNHRTQVARACWGLRAKRRWCLSGTPIQNAIDDLYSYFRFLRYDPYAVYKSFCATIKVPIQRSPANGYKKLQAVLKTIMLRRTKATLLDGEPIISLPPKTINLRKVEFTPEERDFYCRLEADSRAQFEEYAAAGTVKQNYVNILLMLLRLRQACDHPLLVKGCNSNSEWKSSLEKAKKLPLEKRTRLFNCLEASLAICSICSDPPEDAVVTTCEHVFCNQCILEHLSSDDNHCPTSKCKAILNTSSVFSKSTLRASLGHQNITLDCSGSVKLEVIEPCSSSGGSGSSNIEAAEALDSSKIKAAVEVLHSIAKPRELQTNADKGSVVKAVGEKAIVFSQWTRMLDLLEACLINSSIGYRRLDGTMSVFARDKAVKDFNTLPEVNVMIMSLKAASLGLNMVAACHVLLLDLWWNPTTEDQAIDRAHRIGQTRPVSVLRLTVKDTVEDRILALQQKKREMVSSAFGEDETGSSQTRLTVDDLKYLFQA